MLPSAVDSACPEVKESVNLHSFGECFKWHLVIESKIQLPCDKEANDQSSSNSFYITVKSQHSPATFYSCKWSTHQIKANCLSTGWLKDQNPLLLLILNKEQTRTEKKQDGTFCAFVFVISFSPSFCPPGVNLKGHKIRAFHSYPWAEGIWRW